MGGAIQVKGNYAKLTKNTFNKNTAKQSGGAAYLEGTKITVTSNKFTYNKAGKKAVGGAIRISGKSATITKNTFTKNTAVAGFAVWGSGASKKVSGNKVSPKGKNQIRWG